MVNYNNGKVYKLECLTTGLIYIGSTTKEYLSQRLADHIRAFRMYQNGKGYLITSFKVLENNNYRIELLESVNCSSKDELHTREGHYIRTLDCVNRCVMGRTMKEYCAEYYTKNKKEIQDRMKQPFQCECGALIQYSEKARHSKTKKHLNYLNI